MNTQVCKDLFRREPMQGDDSIASRHTPPEADGAIVWNYSSTPMLGITPEYSLSCQPELEILGTETFEEGPASRSGDALLSPSGQLIAMDICCNEDGRIEIIDLTTGSKRKVSDHVTGYKSSLFWGNESELFLWVPDPDPISSREDRIDRLDIHTGERVAYQQLFQYEEPAPEVLAGQLYTGWQVAEVLNVDRYAICRLAHKGAFTPIYAADGTRLISRDDLLAQGGNIKMQDDPSYVTREKLIEMLNHAANVRAVRSAWGFWLIMEGIPGRYGQAIISIDEQTLIANTPITESVVGIYQYGRAVTLDWHSEFFVAPNQCQVEGGYKSVLYRKGQDGAPPVALGILPYPHSHAASAVWSPDGKYIYIDQFALGRYSISRLDLTGFLAEE